MNDDDQGYSPIFYVMLGLGIFGLLGFLLVAGSVTGGM